ncbi:hypothetical protein [Streptomyces sp. KLOTTS4A1]|uniref:hypothetical protein n=1 Tax=Streptomyces sp. KLOTTS4A1 TaxID=3390996 RepID=UPI0039F522A7
MSTSQETGIREHSHAGTRQTGEARKAPPAPSVWRTELFATFPLLTGALVLGVLTLTLGAESAEWMGSWGAVRTHLHITATVACAPLAAAAGSWQGGRERRRGMLGLRVGAARGPLVQFAAAALPVAVWSLVGYALAAAGVLLVNTRYGGAGAPVVGVLVADGVFLASAAFLGHVVGALVPWRLAPPLVAVLGYAAIGASGHSDAALSPAGGFGLDDELPVWWQPWAMAGWTAGLALAAVLAYTAAAGRRTGRPQGSLRSWSALAPLTAAAVCGALLAQGGAGLWHRDPVTERQVCDTSTVPAICVNAMTSGYLPEVRAALLPLTQRLEGVRNLPERWEDLPGAPGPDEAQLPMLVPLGWHARRGRIPSPGLYRWEAAAALSQWECEAGSASDPRAERTISAVRDWLAQDGGRMELHREAERWAVERGDAEEVAAVRAERAARQRLADMSEAERRTWLGEFFAARLSCDPGDVPAL